MIQPHSGPQTAFLSTTADIAIYGGAAGGGKTWALIAEAARHIENPGYRATIFRRNSTQVTNQGGLWDEASSLYPLLGGEPRQHVLEWNFPSGAQVAFRHIQYEGDKLNYQGAALAFIGFDELIHFLESQFWYLLSRNRTICGVKPYIRATCNPDADSWVARLIEWWIDQETGLAIPERSGVLRWFIRVNDRIEWFEEETAAYGAMQKLLSGTNGVDEESLAKLRPKSLTFIAASLHDNPTLMKSNPEYLVNLMGMPLVDRERLLGGNWKIRPMAGNFFRREWFTKFVDAAPSKARRVRYWDKAGGESETADRSAGVKVAELNGDLFIEHAVFGRWSPFKRDEIIEATAEADNCARAHCDLWLEEEPGHNAKQVKIIASKQLARFSPRFDKVDKKKWIRAKPLAAQAEQGNVYIVKGDWNQDLIDELVNFDPEEKGLYHDDLVDATAGAVNRLLVKPEQKPSLPPRGAPGLGRFSR